MCGSKYDVNEADIQNVLEQYSFRVTDTKGRSFETMAAELVGEIDLERVDRAVLSAGADSAAQSQAAFDEIKAILVELGVLEF